MQENPAEPAASPAVPTSAWSGKSWWSSCCMGCCLGFLAILIILLAVGYLRLTHSSFEFGSMERIIERVRSGIPSLRR